MKPDNNIHIKRATIDDIPTIQCLARQCYPIAYTGIHSEEQNLYMMQQMYNSDSLRHQITEEHSCYLLLHLDKEPIGYCAYKPHASQQHTIYLDKLYILPSQKGKGFGKLLVGEVIDIAKRLYPDDYIIRLDVNRSNSARSFYEHLGFQVVRSWDAPIGKGFYMNGFEMMLANEKMSNSYCPMANGEGLVKG